MNKKMVMLFLCVMTIAIIAYLVSSLAITNQSGISFISKVQGCGVTGNSTKFFGKERKAEIRVVNDEIVYSRALSHLCCRKVRIKHEILGNVINIFEIWNGTACRCICFTNITAKIVNLPRGEYVVNVYKTGVEADGKTSMKRELIISKRVKIS